MPKSAVVLVFDYYVNFIWDIEPEVTRSLSQPFSQKFQKWTWPVLKRQSSIDFNAQF